MKTDGETKLENMAYIASINSKNIYEFEYIFERMPSI